ncbi:hypothetical protein PsYK624_041670 [Phanerochaete sordida]|uniref:Polysaccharide lyase 14 domain-containing protein n=1 Tax=Phanerochaete sordida TaxID=48140 RepID=A0A9P3G5X0_9APHY|nr:hypothetical protein PsYK624_041670 [Phanerochaete sordida]
MFVYKSLVALLALAASISAHPSAESIHRRHHRIRDLSRRTCHPRAATSATSASSAAPHTSSTEDATSTSSVHQASSTHSSAAAVQTSNALSIHTNLAALAPIANILESWSTAPEAPAALPLEDSTFRPHNAISALQHPYVPAPDGPISMKATYPQGSWNFENRPLGGFSFYGPGPNDVDLTTAKEVTFGYTIYYEDGFEFNLGGKLPGIYGGDSDEVALSCSGGKRDNRCFSARLMWRQNGAGEMYTYLPQAYSANDAVCDVPPFSTCNDVYGASVGRGSFKFAAGKATSVSMRVRLNDVNQQNGELELWADGQSVINVGGLVLRDSDAGRIRGMMMQTFFGGSTQNYASPKDQHVYFRDFTIAITEKL